MPTTLPDALQQTLAALQPQYPDHHADSSQAAAYWQAILPQLSAHPFAVHCAAKAAIFGQQPAPILWQPDDATRQRAHITDWMQTVGLDNYEAFHQWSVAHRAEFWQGAVERLGIRFHTPPQATLQGDDPTNPVWFPGAQMNIVASIFAGVDPDKVAILDSTETSETRRTTYGELEQLVNRVASGLLAHGLNPGSRVVLYVPLSLESCAAYLGLLKAGMQAVLVADSFSAHELKRRIDILAAEAIICYDAYGYGGKNLPIYGKVKEAEAPMAIVVPGTDARPDLREGDLLWADMLGSAEADYHYATPDAVTTVLFSSGTTKAPKAIPWTQLTPIKGATDAHFHHDIHPEDVVTWTTSMGWMMGPWTLFAGLLNGASVALFTGAGAVPRFRDFLQDSGVTMLGCIPSLVKVWRNKGLLEGALGGIRCFSSTGEPSNAEDYTYLMSLTGYRAPVIEYCGGTEIGGGYLTGSTVQPASPATFTTPALGLGLYLLDAANQPITPGQAGQVFLVPPSIGLSQKLLNRNHHQEYYAGAPTGPQGEVLRRHGDAFDLMEAVFEGQPLHFYKSSGRVDDAMNIGGIKVSAVEIEEALQQHPALFEAAAISVSSGSGPEKLVVYFVPADPTANHDLAALRKELQAILNGELNPLFRLAEIVLTDKMPRTASNKVMRRQLRQLYQQVG